MRRSRLLILLALLCAVLPTLAQDTNEDTTAYLRVGHFVSDAPAVDIYIDDTLRFEALTYLTVTDWQAFETGTYFVSVVEAGSENIEDDALLTGAYTLRAGEWLTLAAIGTLADESVTLEPLVEAYEEDLQEDAALVTVLHAIPEVDPVNILVDDAVELEALAYIGDDGAEGFDSIFLGAGDYAFDVQNEDGDTLLSAESTIEVGLAYFIVAAGTADEPEIILVSTDVDSVITENATNDTASTLLARVGHFSVSAPLVDIYLDGELALDNVDFGDLSAYFEIAAGTYEVALVATGDGLENALYTGNITLIADSITLIAAIGFVGNDSLEVVTADENALAPQNGRTRIAFFQAVPSISLFDLLANDATLIQGVAYPNVFAGAGDGYVSVDVAAGEYELEVQGAGNIVNIGNILMGANRVYLVVVSGTEQSPLYFLVPGDFPTQTE